MGIQLQNLMDYQFQSSSFLIAFKIILEVLSQLRALTVKLQMQAEDVLHAYKQVCDITSSFKQMREESEKEFKIIFEETTQLGKDLHGNAFQLSQPRIVGSQIYRSNVQTPSVEDYYRITVYNEFLSHVIREIYK